MSNQKLTIKQKKFADEYIKTGNASESYKKAYSTKNMSDDAIRVEGNRTLKNPYVKDYIDKRMKKLDFIGMELDEKYFEIAKQRINEA